MHKFEVKGKLYAATTAIIFLLIAVLHGLRAFYEWDLVYATWSVPVWLSWLVAFLGFILSITAIRRM